MMYWFKVFIRQLAIFALACLSLPAGAQTTGAFTLNDWVATKPELKNLYAKTIMEQAQVHKVHFQKSAGFYHQELDKLATFSQAHNHPRLLQAPVAQSLATIAVVNCDWDNGIPPYEFALKYIGKEQLELLKNLYADAITKLQNNCQ